MTDSEFLWWLHDRLNKVHGENQMLDYMWRLRSIASHLENYDECDKKKPPQARENLGGLRVAREEEQPLSGEMEGINPGG